VKTHLFSFLVLFAAIVCCGCEDGVVDCTLIAVPGIRVELVDARTGHSPEPQQFIGVAADGEYRDSVVTFGGRLRFAFERPGIYDVRIWGEGYDVWTADNVRVRDGRCHVGTVELVARLEPAAP
jgi:hypothetical protein